MARRRSRSTGAFHHITSIHLCEKHPVRRTEAVRKDNQVLMPGVRGQAGGQVAAGRACGSHDTDKLARLWCERRYQDVPEEAAAAECVFLSPSLPPCPSSQTIWSCSLPALPPRSLHATCSLSKPNLSPPSPALSAYVCVCLSACASAFNNSNTVSLWRTVREVGVPPEADSGPESLRRRWWGSERERGRRIFRNNSACFKDKGMRLDGGWGGGVTYLRINGGIY